MFVYRRPVRFADIDAARILFFARYLDYCHDALEALFGGLEGGYARLTMERDLGIPTVHAALDYRAPLRYGDVVRFEIVVTRLGRTSIHFRHRLVREPGDVLCAEVAQVVVLTRLSTLTPEPFPADVRALLEPLAVAAG
jgi:4-hydroxybenzoyl-CoA thioesterase